MNGQNAAPAGLSVRDVASILGRNQGPELFFQQPFAILTQPIIPKTISLNRPLERIHIVWRGRIAVTVAAYTSVFPEAAQNIIQRILVNGTHRRFGAIVPVDLTGPTAYQWASLFTPYGGTLYDTIPAGGTDNNRAAAVANQTGNFDGSVGNHDVEIHYSIPVWPVVNNAAKLTAVPFLWQQRDWEDTLRVQLFFGDRTSLGVPAAGTVVAFEQFGGGVGTSPTVSIFTNYEILGPLADSVVSAVCIRAESPVTGVVTGIANNVRLAQLQKQKTTNIVFKTGTIPAAGLSAGVQVFDTLVDTILDRTQVLVDNKPLRNNFANFALKGYNNQAFRTLIRRGYNFFSFIDSQNPLTYFRGDLLSGGSQFELQSDIRTAGATQAVNMIQEQVLGEPGAA